MKTRIANYTFNKTTKKVVFTDYTTITLDAILLISNASRGEILYSFANPALGASVSGNEVTLEIDTSLMSDADSLLIFYDDVAKEPATVADIQDIPNGLNNQLAWMFRKLMTLLKPLAMVTGGGSNRLSVDVNSGSVTIGSGTVTTVSTVTTVATVTPRDLGTDSMANTRAFPYAKDSARNAYSLGIRSKISF